MMKFFTAGPVSTSENMKISVYHPIGHRENEFCDLFKTVTGKLLKVFKANTQDYSVVVINGSGTAAVEAVLTSVVGNRKILVVNNGAFGERLGEICSVQGLNVEVLKFGWAERIDLNLLEGKLRKGVGFLAMVHHETSTGALNPVCKVGELCRNYDTVFIVDCMSSLGGESLSVVDDQIDFAISNTNKCLCGLPVLSFICIKNQTLENLRGTKPKTFYLDLFRHYDYAKKCQTPCTPQIPLYYMLNKALDELLAEGLNNRIERYHSNARLLRSLLKSVGFKFYLKENQMGSVVTNVVIPKNIVYQRLHDELKKRGYVIYPGKGELEGKVVNLGHIGILSATDIRQFCSDFVEVIRGAHWPAL